MDIFVLCFVKYNMEGGDEISEIETFSLEEVQKLLANGVVQENDLGYYEGATNWMPLKDIPALKSPFLARIIPMLWYPCAC